MHYGCASFEIFWILAIIIFERVFTFPPRRWFAPHISLWFPACIHNNKIFELAPPLCLSLSRNCSYYSCCEGNYAALCQPNCILEGSWDGAGIQSPVSTTGQACVHDTRQIHVGFAPAESISTPLAYWCPVIPGICSQICSTDPSGCQNCPIESLHIWYSFRVQTIVFMDGVILKLAVLFLKKKLYWLHEYSD